MADTSIERHSWQLTRDEQGNREYTIKWQIKAASTTAGPAEIMTTPGLPAIGSYWNFGTDFDIWAICTPYLKVTPREKKEIGYYWDVEQKFRTPRFSDRDNDEATRCNDTPVDNPLLEPDRISGSFVKYTQEVQYDKDDNLIRTTSHEVIRGPAVEFDFNRPTVTIEQIVSLLGLDTFSQMIDTVNSSPLWGLPARCIKLSNVSWKRLVYGSCTYYYVRTLEFDVNYNTFDRTVLDEGTKVLSGHWDDGTWVTDNIGGGAPSTSNPSHFIRYKDQRGEYAKVLLKSNGQPATSQAEANTIDINYYGESNFLLLGIPTSL